MGSWRKWSADEVRLLGTMPDADVARATGRRTGNVIHKRQSLGIGTAPCAAPTVETGKVVVALDKALGPKLDELALLLVERYRDAGLPVDRLERWQVIEVALNDALATAKRAKTRKLFAPGQER